MGGQKYVDLCQINVQLTLWLEAGLSGGMNGLDNLKTVFIISFCWAFDKVDGYVFYFME